MDRRSFLKASSAAAIAAPAAAVAPISAAIRKPDGIRVSCVPGDPGERAYSIACGDGKRVEVYLDGALQRYALTADESEGFVTRVVTTPEGNMAFNRATGEAYEETVYGDVRIEII